MSLSAIPIAFLAGFVSFLAPCVLPLVPGYLSAVSAVDADKLGQPGNASRGLAHPEAVPPRVAARARAGAP